MINDPDNTDIRYEILSDDELVAITLELLDQFDEAFKELAL